MAQNSPYPIPRQYRQTSVLSGNGGTVYGPFTFKVFDVVDVEVWARRAGEAGFTLVAATVTKTADLPYDTFTIALPDALASTSRFVVRSARLPSRAAGVLSGTRLSMDALEKEFSKIAATEQELRRDIERAVLSDFGMPGLRISDVPEGALLMRGGQDTIVRGPTADQIARAQEYAETAANIVETLYGGPLMDPFADFRTAMMRVEHPFQVTDEDGWPLIYVDEAGRFGAYDTIEKSLLPFADPDYQLHLRDRDGRLIFGLTWGGAVHTSGLSIEGTPTFGVDLSEPVAWVKSDDAWVKWEPVPYSVDTTRGGNGRRLTYSTVTGDKAYNAQIINRSVRWVRETVSGERTIEIADLVPETTAFAGATSLSGIFVYGQSLSIGTQAGSVVTPTALSPGRGLMFAAGVRILSPLSHAQDADPETEVVPTSNMRGLVDAHEAQNSSSRETVASRMLQVLAASAPAGKVYMAATAGISGLSYAGLKKGTNPYRNLLRAVEAAKRIADAKGWAYDVPTVVWIAGEADANAGDTQAVYLAKLIELQNDLDTDIKVITGQANTVKLTISQTASFTNNGSGGGLARSEVPAAMLKAAVDTPSKFIFAGPKYHLLYAPDGIHILAASQAQHGADIGRALKTELIDATPFVPLRMASATRSGTAVTVTFTGNVGSIVSDTALVSNPGALGFVFRNSVGASIAITAASVSGGSTVALTLASAPANTTNTIELAINFAGSLPANAGPTTGARTPLRDSTSGNDALGNPQYKRAAAGIITCN